MRSIYLSDFARESRVTIENAIGKIVGGLELEQLDRDLFLGNPGEGTGRLFGGMVAAQSTMAAQMTVEEGNLHSIHSYFLRGGSYDQPLRFVVHRITQLESQYKLCKVRTKKLGDKGVPCVNLHDGRTIRYPDPEIKESDTVMVDISSNTITNHFKFDAGALAMITGGRNAGRVGVIQRREKHKGSFEIIHVQDAAGHQFATRATNVFVIGEGNKPMVSLPKGKGIKLSIVEELEKRKEA